MFQRRQYYESDSYDDLLNYESLDRDEEIRLLNEAQSGCIEARNTLILYNMRGISAICEFYKGNGVEKQELYGVAIESFIKCIKVFKPHGVYEGIRLISFARRAIHGGIQKSDESNSYTIKIPSHIRQAHYHIRSLLSNINFENFTIDELIDYLIPQINISKKIIRFIIEDYDYISNLISLDSIIPSQKKSDNPSTFCDIIEDPIDFISEINSHIDLETIIICLSKREKDIVYRRWGILPQETYAEIGKRLGITRGAVFNSYTRAMRKLKIKAKELIALE